MSAAARGARCASKSAKEMTAVGAACLPAGTSFRPVHSRFQRAFSNAETPIQKPSRDHIKRRLEDGGFDNAAALASTCRKTQIDFEILVPWTM